MTDARSGRLTADGDSVNEATWSSANAQSRIYVGESSAQAGRIDFDRLMMLRRAGNFDRPHPGQSTMASLWESAEIEIAFDLALDNVYHAGSVVAKDILSDWNKWKDCPAAA